MEQIVGHLWDFDFDSVSNVLDAHMKNLRKKVDGGYDEKLFETVRGMGYRLNSKTSQGSDPRRQRTRRGNKYPDHYSWIQVVGA